MSNCKKVLCSLGVVIGISLCSLILARILDALPLMIICFIGGGVLTVLFILVFHGLPD